MKFETNLPNSPEIKITNLKPAMQMSNKNSLNTDTDRAKYESGAKQRTQDLPPITTNDLYPLSFSEKYEGRNYLAATCGQNRVAVLFSKQPAARRICSPSKCGQALRREK